MKKFIVAAVAAASLTGGAVALAAFSPIGIASAQDQAQTQTPGATTQTAPKVKPARRAAIRARVKQVVKAQRGDVATYLGITPDELKQELQSGKSVAEIAGPKTQGLVDTLTTKVDDQIDAAVAANKIDAARAATLKTKAAALIERRINAKRPIANTTH